MPKNAIAHTITLFTAPDKILAEVKPSRFTQKHVLSDDYENDLADRPYTRLRKRNRKAPVVTHSGQDRVTGVRHDGDQWVATISCNRHRNVVYRGESREDAIKARKEAELQRPTVLEPKNPHLPRGVYEIKNKRSTKYVASCEKDGRTHKLYYGPSLTTAVAIRQEWEREQGFDRYHALNCFRVSKQLRKGNKSGVTGVSRCHGRYWLAIGSADNVRYRLYFGPSKKAAIKARKAWEETMQK